MRVRALVTSLLIGAAVFPRPGRAQDTSGITNSILINPGARSIGLGGAFAAIADDATAAFANPAGLVQIARPEISVELRGTASRSNIGSEVQQGVSGIGFFSFVYPSQKWALSLYSHQLASVGFEITHTDVLTQEFTVRSYATAAAYEFSEHLSLGAGLSYFVGDRSRGVGSSGFSDDDWGINAGVLWKVSRTWNLATFYRQGPEFESRDTPTRFSFPTRYGVGVAFQPKAGALTFGFEWDEVGRTMNPLQDGHIGTEGGTEYHLGVEYAVLRWKPVVAFRAGLWRESDRRYLVTFDGSAVETFSDNDRNHAAFGFGLAFKRFQIDVGVDLSGQDVVGSASFVYSF